MLTIDSRANLTFKKLHSLTTAKGLKKEGLFLLCGENLIREFLKSSQLKIHSEIVAPKLKPLLKSSASISLAPALFDEVDSVGTGFNILVIEQPLMEKVEARALGSYKPRGLELVVPLGDPANLGAMLRSAEAFGVSRVILTEEAAHPFLPKAVKASAGSVLRLPILRGPALCTFPDSCIALDMSGVAIDTFVWPKDAMLVVGEEGKGLGHAQFKRRISIPTKGVESLNAVVAASVALALRQRAI
jgi:RNA methyltransferase, TrmH family